MSRGVTLSQSTKQISMPLFPALQSLCVVIQECVQALLTDEQLRDIADQEGRTALMWATQNGNYVAMQLLLESQVTDVHACEKNGTTGQYHITVFYCIP